MADTLAGVRVLDLTRMLAGPYGTLLLADLGAEVVKVEEPDGGDPIRAMGPHFVAGTSPPLSAYFLAVNRGKKSVVLDLRDASGRAAFHDLVRAADVLVENFRPSVPARLGCDWATLRSVNPRLVVCSISAFGHDGPDRERPAFDLSLQARGGAMSLTGEPGGAPVRMGVPMGDLAGGLFGALAVTAALYRRERTGRGQWIDLGLLDCQVALLTYMAQFYLTAGDVLGPQGSGHRNVVPYRVFRAADGWLVVAIFQEKFWGALCRALERPELAENPRFASNDLRREARAELEPMLDEAFARRGVAAWLAALEREAVPCAPVQTVEQVLLDPQVVARGLRAEVLVPTAGGPRAESVVGSCLKMDSSPGGRGPTAAGAAGPTAVTGAPLAGCPLLGEHTAEVLRAWAGYEAERAATFYTVSPQDHS
jgi:crotonobetainyl-CoA:carnitine CoA-transferase CaiB-like acyl-CoA transferase